MIPEAERWFNQAKKDLEAASWNFEGKLYIPSRYPNGLPDSIPSEVYLKQDAEVSIDQSQRVLRLVSNLLFE